MATPTTPRICLRGLGTQRASHINRQAIGASQRFIHIPSPLYLDFLAPSWRTAWPKAVARSSIQQQQLDSRSQRRYLSETPSRRATAITNPRKDDNGNAMTITISPRAAQRLRTISATDKNPHLALRVTVESGGCHGFQYLMSLVSTQDIDAAEDTVFQDEAPSHSDGGKGDAGGKGAEYKAKVVIDEPSLELLNGSCIDFTMELIGSQFKVTGIPGAKSSCGCGTSFDIAV